MGSGVPQSAHFSAGLHLQLWSAVMALMQNQSTYIDSELAQTTLGVGRRPSTDL